MSGGGHGTPIAPREAAAWVARRLREAGFRALFAGGCVRDTLLGLEASDYDVATDASPDEVRRVFPRAIGVGESFGVMLVRHGGRSVEVATFRADGSYADGRRPEGVRFTDDREDALRRDFTVNGMFEDPETGEVIDHVGGRADLEARILRAIGDPAARMREDRLRTLRAARFAARFGLAIEPATEEAVRRFAGDLAAVSRERIGNEVRRMLAHPSRARAVELVDRLGLASSVLLEPAGAAATDLSLVAALPPGAGLEESLAAWMLGRPGADGVREAGAARQRAWREALVLSNGESDLLAAILANHERLPARWPAGDVAARKRLASSPGFRGALALLAGGGHPVAATVQDELPALEAQGLAPAPLVTGDDLVAIGLAPGPAFRPLLDRAYDEQLNGRIVDRAQALGALRGWIRDALPG